MLETDCYPLLIDGNRGTVWLWDLSRECCVIQQSIRVKCWHPKSHTGPPNLALLFLWAILCLCPYKSGSDPCSKGRQRREGADLSHQCLGALCDLGSGCHSVAKGKRSAPHLPAWWLQTFLWSLKTNSSSLLHRLGKAKWFSSVWIKHTARNLVCTPLCAVCMVPGDPGSWHWCHLQKWIWTAGGSQPGVSQRDGERNQSRNCWQSSANWLLHISRCCS